MKNQKGVIKMARKTIVFDFDGVIHKGYDGWRDGNIYGELDRDLMSFIVELMDEYYIVISSNRPAEQIVEYLTQAGYPVELFNKDMGDNMYWRNPAAIGVTNAKAVGVLYIDDHGLRYNPSHSTRRSIKDIRKALKTLC